MSIDPIIYSQEPVLTPRQRLRDDIKQIAHRHGTTYDEIMAGKRHVHVTRARIEAIRHTRATFPRWSSVQIAAFFGRDHSTVLYALDRLSRRGPSQRVLP